MPASAPTRCRPSSPPIIVNRLATNQLGDTGFWFLVRGDEAFPDVALVNEHARLLADDTIEIDTEFGGIATAVELRARLDE